MVILPIEIVLHVVLCNYMFLTDNVLTELAKAWRTSPVAHYSFQLLTTLLKILGGNKFLCPGFSGSSFKRMLELYGVEQECL